MPGDKALFNEEVPLSVHHPPGPGVEPLGAGVRERVGGQGGSQAGEPQCVGVQALQGCWLRGTLLFPVECTRGPEGDLSPVRRLGGLALGGGLGMVGRWPC